jgi:hypothetical protein
LPYPPPEPIRITRPEAAARIGVRPRGRNYIARAQELEGEGPLALLERRQIDGSHADC